MKIGIMAPEDSGKTSYLVGLYGTLVHDKNRQLSSEYGLYYEWVNKDQKGELEYQFGMLLQEKGKQRFPRKKKGIIYHRIGVECKDEKVSREIELIDFPGGLLRGNIPSNTEGDKKGNDLILTAENVEAALTECDGFIVLLDATHFKTPAIKDGSEYDEAYWTAANDIAHVIEQTVQKRAHGTTGVPVALCISKYDLIPYDQKPSAFENFQKLFPRFFTTTFAHPIFMTCVSLGAGIEDGAKFDPLHLEKPLEFCLAMCAFNERDSERKQAEKIEKNIPKLKNMNAFQAFMAGVISVYTLGLPLIIVNHYYQMMKQHLSKAEEFARIGEEAVKPIRGVDNQGIIYYKGKKHRFKNEIGTDFPLEELIKR